MRWYVIGIVLALIACTIGLSIIMSQAIPSEASLMLLTLFFASLFVWLWSAATLAGYAVKKRRYPNTWAETAFIKSFGQAFFIALAAFAVFLIKKFLF